MNTQLIKQHLTEHGWAIVPDILTSEEILSAKESFYAWQKTIPNHDTIHSKCDPRGIYKHHEAGHQQHAWFIRTRPAVQAIFKQLLGCEDLIVSFDGACFISKENHSGCCLATCSADINSNMRIGNKATCIKNCCGSVGGGQASFCGSDDEWQTCSTCGAQYCLPPAPLAL